MQEAEVVINCHTTKDKAVVSWVPYSKAKERYRELHGKVLDSQGEVQYLLHGAWDKGMTRKKPGEGGEGREGGRERMETGWVYYLQHLRQLDFIN